MVRWQVCDNNDDHRPDQSNQIQMYYICMYIYIYVCTVYVCIHTPHIFRESIKDAFKSGLGFSPPNSRWQQVGTFTFRGCIPLMDA